jgi:ribosomal protein S18 acetylase RimI-like enzyme
MNIEFHKARIPEESGRLARFDKKVFGSESFPKSYWQEYESWWMVLDGKPIACCAFKANVDFEPEPNKEDPRRKGSLFIATTAVAAEFRGYSFGSVMKAWQVAYARFFKFKRIVTNSRESNVAMIGLNRAFGFRKLKTYPKYHDDPEEATVVMELVLADPSKRSVPR